MCSTCSTKSRKFIFIFYAHQLCIACVDHFDLMHLCVYFTAFVFLDALCSPATKGLSLNLHHHHHRHGHTAVVESVSRTVGRLRASMGKGRHKAACRWRQNPSQVSAPESLCVER